jgi:hypothetical protein
VIGDCAKHSCAGRLSLSAARGPGRRSLKAAMAIYTLLGLAPHRSAPVPATRAVTRGDIIIPAWILQTPTKSMGAVLNTEVCNICQMPFWLLKKAFFLGGGHFTKMCSVKFPTSHSEGLSKNCLSQNTVAAFCK